MNAKELNDLAQEFGQFLNDNFGKQFDLDKTYLIDEINEEFDFDLDTRIQAKSTKGDVYFKATQFPECCGYLVFHSASLEMNENTTKLAVKFMEYLAQFLAFAGAMYVTLDRRSYSYLNKVFEENKWELEEVVENPHTGNILKRWYFKCR